MPQNRQLYGDNNQYSLNRSDTGTGTGMFSRGLDAQGTLQGMRSRYQGPPQQFGRALPVSAMPSGPLGPYSSYCIQRQTTPPGQVGMVQGTVWNRTSGTQQTMPHGKSGMHRSSQKFNQAHQFCQPEVHREPSCPPHHPIFTGTSPPSYFPNRSINNPQNTHGEDRVKSPSNERIRHMSLWQRPNVPICRPYGGN